MRAAAKFLLAAFVSLVAAAAAAQDEPAAAAKPAPQPWVVECSNRTTGGALVCQMSQSLIAKNTGQRVLSAVLARKPDGKALVLTLGLPHGLNLPAGVQLSVDGGEKVPVPIETADQNGSYASLEIAPDMLAAMKKGTMLNVAVKSKAGDDLVLQLSLTGFSGALAHL